MRVPMGAVRRGTATTYHLEGRKVGVLTRFEPGDGVTPVGVRSSCLPLRLSDVQRTSIPGS